MSRAVWTLHSAQITTITSNHNLPMKQCCVHYRVRVAMCDIWFTYIVSENECTIIKALIKPPASSFIIFINALRSISIDKHGNNDIKTVHLQKHILQFLCSHIHMCIMMLLNLVILKHTSENYFQSRHFFYKTIYAISFMNYSCYSFTMTLMKVNFLWR